MKEAPAGTAVVSEPNQRLRSSDFYNSNSVAELVDWVVRELAPIWIDVVGLHQHADTVRSLAPITRRVLFEQPRLVRKCTALLVGIGADVVRRTETLRWTFPSASQTVAASGLDDVIREQVEIARGLTVALGGCRGAVAGAAAVCLYPSTLVPRGPRGRQARDAARGASRTSFARLVSAIRAVDAGAVDGVQR